MSQSPESSAGLTPASPRLQAYLQNFDALGAMIGRGRSFSGRERNCCFLNTGDGHFSDVSAATGLDFIDDGRGVALVDWDQDGDLDLWISNRTSPRLRFVKNDMRIENHYLALKLEGRDCNRDAIGARVEVVTSRASRVQSPEQGRHVTSNSSLSTLDSGLSAFSKTLYAGNSFLSQSSKWLHFGLGKSEHVERVVVHWPGGNKPESYGGFDVDRRYKITQGDGRPVLVDVAPRRVELKPSEPAIPDPAAGGRIRLVLSRRIPLPHIAIDDFEGKRQHVVPPTSGGLLITLWASWCAPCRAELTELSDGAEELRNRRVNVLALATDGLLDGEEDGATKARTYLNTLNWPFSSAMASDHALRDLTLMQHELVYRQRALPLPSSFLVDSKRQIAVIYGGRVSIEQVLKDADLLDATPDQIAVSSLPFPGRFASRMFRRDAMAHVVAYLEGGYLADAKRELLTFIEENVASIESGTGSDGDRDKRTLADAYRLLATLEKDEGRLAEAVAANRRLVKLLPRQATVRISLALAIWKLKDRQAALKELDTAAELVLDEARMQHLLAQSYEQIGALDKALVWYRQAVERDPESTRYRTNLAARLQSKGDATEAIKHYRRVLDQQPDRIDAANNLSWILATHGDSQVRDPSEALSLATRIAERTKEEDPSILDTFAAALASAGQYSKAATIARKAIQLARQKQNVALADMIEARLQLYQQSMPYHEPVSN